MADDVYLHIGPPKTGTTYIQQVLWENKENLARQQIFLPLGRRRLQYDAVADLRGGLWANAKLSTTWDKLVKKAHRRPGTSVVSEELLAAMPDVRSFERAVTSLAPARVHIICAVRDYGRGVPANYQQALRARSMRTYDNYLQMIQDPANELWRLQDPARLYEAWSPFLEGPECFHVVTVPATGAPRELLWERFATVIGADPAGVDLTDQPRNESLGVREAELLRRFNARLGDRFPLPSPYIENVTKNFIRPALRTSPEIVRIGVPERHVEWLTARSDALVESVRTLAEKVDLVGDVEDLRAQITPEALAGDQLTEEELLNGALDALIRQLEFMRDKKLELEAVAEVEARSREYQEQEAVAAERAYARSPRGRVRRAGKALLGRA